MKIMKQLNIRENNNKKKNGPITNHAKKDKKFYSNALSQINLDQYFFFWKGRGKPLGSGTSTSDPYL